MRAMIRTPIACAFAALLVAAAGAPALAQKGPAPAAGQRAEAEQLFRSGERFFKAGQFVNAYESFEQAYQVLPLPAIAFSAAQAYRLQYAVDKDPRKLKRAVELYERYVAEDPKGGRVAEAARKLDELRGQLSELERKGGTPIASMPIGEKSTKLMVTTVADVPGARASVDGGKPESLPLMVEVTPGRHRVVVEADGYITFDEQREALEGLTRPIEIDLEPKPAIVRVRAASGAQVSVDGRPAGTTPLVRPLELSAGKHLITVTRRGNRAWSREVTLARGQAVSLEPSLERTGQRTVSYVLLGTAAALAVGSGVTFALSIKAGSDADELNEKRESEGLTASELGAYNDALDRRSDRLQATYVLFGVGVAVAASGAILYFMDNPGAEGEASASTSSSLTVAPVTGGDSLGLALGGRF
jgi:tetratricopeptide (TPR) repeat protein